MTAWDGKIKVHSNFENSSMVYKMFTCDVKQTQIVVKGPKYATTGIVILRGQLATATNYCALIVDIVYIMAG